MSQRNWFDDGGQAYARFRPEYPPALAGYLASAATGTQLAVDVGCGNGQLTKLLAPHFSAVVGIDPSADQIAHAAPAANIRYQCAPAEQLPLADASASLICAAQAAHWFDLPRFYDEVRRVAAPGAVLALISYGVLQLEPALNQRFEQFYWHEIGPYWPPERKLVDTGYRSIDFPFAELPAPALSIGVEWALAELLGYIATWSAARGAREAGRQDLLQRFADDLAHAWGDQRQKRAVSWPVNMRIGVAAPLY